MAEGEVLTEREVVRMRAFGAERTVIRRDLRRPLHDVASRGVARTATRHHERDHRPMHHQRGLHIGVVQTKRPAANADHRAAVSRKPQLLDPAKPEGAQLLEQ